MTLSCRLLVIGAVAALLAPSTFSQTYTQIDVPGAALTSVLGIDSAGDVVGYYENSVGFYGFLLSAGVYTTIAYPGCSSAVAASINDKGQIVGYACPLSVGFMYDIATQTFTSINFPGSTYTLPSAINNDNVVVGSYYVASTNSGASFEMISQRYKSITPPRASSSWASGIAGNGMIVGGAQISGQSFSYSYDHGVYRKITIPNTPLAFVQGVNPQSTALTGTISFSDSATEIGYVYHDNVVTTLQFPAAPRTIPYGINASGTVAGTFIDTLGMEHGFIWSPSAKKMSETPVALLGD